MGYNTKFKGTLGFNRNLNADEMDKLYFLLDECDLVFDGDIGVKWKGQEKNYTMMEDLIAITSEMRKEIPDFAFTGYMLAQGEDVSDRWMLEMVDGVPYKRVIGDKIVCPHCGGRIFDEVVKVQL